jgi:diadenosine tetraphosphate (Ap4A) HIT family hydrolase
MTLDCISCKTVQGLIKPIGGVLYENSSWIVFLRSRPSLAAGQGFIVLKRHCEAVAELTALEQETLGVIMAKTARAMSVVLKPEKVHFGLYAEGITHLHLHVTPRLAALPAGNIPLTALGVWFGMLERLKLRSPIPDSAVQAVAAELKVAFVKIGSADS